MTESKDTVVYMTRRLEKGLLDRMKNMKALTGLPIQRQVNEALRIGLGFLEERYLNGEKGDMNDE